jgi:hypothetical protein
MATSHTPDGTPRNYNEFNYDEDSNILNINLPEDKFQRARVSMPIVSKANIDNSGK